MGLHKLKKKQLLELLEEKYKETKTLNSKLNI